MIRLISAGCSDTLSERQDSDTIKCQKEVREVKCSALKDRKKTMISFGVMVLSLKSQQRR